MGGGKDEIFILINWILFTIEVAGFIWQCELPHTLFQSKKNLAFNCLIPYSEVKKN